MEKRFHQIRNAARVVAGLTLILVGLGAFVRSTGAGLACPDWPLCFGRIVPELESGVTQEYFHRVVAGIVSLCTCYLIYHAFRVRKSSPRTWYFAMFMGILLGIQVIFGGLTVTMKLNPFIVTTHLMLGTLFFQLASLAAIERLHPRPIDSSAGSMATGTISLTTFRRIILALLVFTVLQIAIGGFVGSSGASLVCPDFPTCNGAWLPEFGPQIVQMVHRLTGILVLLLSIVAVVCVKKTAGVRRQKRGHLFGIVFMIFIQIGIGVGSIHTGVPYWIVVPHLIVAQMILLGIASLYKELCPDLRVFELEPDAQGLSASNKANVVPMRQRRAVN